MNNMEYLNKLPILTDYLSANCPIAFKICNEPWSFNFYKLCSILENICKTSGLKYQEIIFFSRKDSYGFPTSEISNLKLTENRIIIETTFLNLYGVHHALPEYFGNTIINNENGAEALKAFLDILHSRVTHLYYEEWKHFKLYYNESRCINFLDPIGLCSKYFSQFENDFRNLQPFFIKKNINANLIKGILKYYFVNNKIIIKSFQKKAMIIDNSFTLNGRKLSYTEPIVLGTKLYSTNYDLKAFVEIDSYEEYMMLLKDDDLKHSLLCLLRAFLDKIYHIKIYLLLTDNSARYSRLGTDQIILGKSSFMGKPSQMISILFGSI